MSKHKDELLKWLNRAFIMAAVIIIADLILPGSVINDEIINLQSERQQYNNAAGNYHYSYKVVTREHQFSVGEDFAGLIKGHEKIEYSVSRLFKEANWFRLFSSEKKAFYSLRIMTGLVVPLLSIISVIVAYSYKKSIGILVLVLQVLLIADFIFLIL